jgi:hypothetical protein
VCVATLKPERFSLCPKSTIVLTFTFVITNLLLDNKYMNNLTKMAKIFECTLHKIDIRMDNKLIQTLNIISCEGNVN